MINRAIIVGSSSKLGRHIIKYLARKGYELILHYNRNYERVKSLLSDYLISNKVLGVIQYDFLRGSITDFIDHLRRFEPFSTVIILTSIYDDTPIQIIDEGRIREILSVNLLSITSLTLLVGRLMRRWGSGLIVIFSDLISLRTSNPYSGINPSIPYIVSKAGLNALIRFSARELAPIRIVGIAPGWVEHEGLTLKLKEGIRMSVPIGRAARPDEVVKALDFVINNEYVNGAVIELSGGL